MNEWNKMNSSHLTFIFIFKWKNTRILLQNVLYLQMKKIQDKAEKCHREVETTQQKYEGALSDLNNYNPKYMEDMSLVFQKSDQNEEKRLVFFKEMLFGVHKCLDTSQNVQYVSDLVGVIYTGYVAVEFRMEYK